MISWDMNKYKIIIYLLLMYDGVDSNSSESRENYNKNLQIVSNQLTVEQHYFANTKYHESKVKRFLSKAHIITDICNRSKDKKIAFCERVLQNDLLGFKFNLQNYQNPTCKDQTFSLAFNRDEEAGKIQMYSCPRIKYIDIETGDETSLEYKFLVSRGTDRRTAIIFFQREVDVKRFPFYFVSGISFSKLKLDKPDVSASQPNSIIWSYKDHEIDSIKHFLEAKQLSEPYTKFTQLFSAKNICGFRRSHKIHLCKHNLGEHLEHMELDTEGYDGNTCKRFNVFKWSESDPAKSKGKNLKNQLSLLRCPSTIDTRKMEHPAPFEIKNLALYYIAVDIVPGFVTLFEEDIRQEGEPRNQFSLKIVTDKLLQQDIRRVRFLPYPSESERRKYPLHIATFSELENQMDDVTSWPTVQTPSVIAQNDKMWFRQRNFEADEPRPLQNRWFMEDVLVKFSQIKAMKQIYQRFRETHASLDICELSAYQRRTLCTGTSQNFKLSGKIERCVRKKITLVTRRVQVLESNNFSMWRCPTNTYSSIYDNYVSKTHLRDTAILFRVYETKEIVKPVVIYPDILLAGINRLMLAYKDD